MEHEWSKRLDVDVEFTNSKTGERMTLPCWRLCVGENAKAIEKTQEAYAAATAQGYDANVFVPHGWGHAAQGV